MKLTRGDEIERIERGYGEKEKSYTYKVTVVTEDKNKMLRICTDRGVVFRPEDVMRKAPKAIQTDQDERAMAGVVDSIVIRL